jgi:outer membrane protein TolC
MLHSKRIVLLLSSFFLTFSAIAIPARSQEFPVSVCEVAIHEELVELQDYRNTVDLAVSNYEAYLKIFKMIEGLHEGNTIPRMDYIKAKYDRDAAELELERSNLILERQAALLEQYRLACGMTETDEKDIAADIGKEYLKYRRADCDSLGKGVEVAATNLEFNREYLKNIRKLRNENFATRTQVVLAELDVELEEKNLADTQRRTAACRDELAVLEVEIR